MKIRWFAVVAALVAAFSFVTAQGTGGTAFFPKNPSRVVLGGRAVTMVADAVYAFSSARASVVSVAGTDQGLGSFLNAVDPGFLDKPSLDRSASAESYAALKPDLVILKETMRSSLGSGLSALGVPTLYLNLETPDDYYADIQTLGSVFGEEERAAGLVAYYKDVVARVSSAAAGAKKAGVKVPRVLVMQAKGSAYEVPPDTWMQTVLVEMAGGAPVWKGANPGSGWAAVSPEQVLAWNPDIVILISYKQNAGTLVPAMKGDARFSALPALKAGKVYGFPQDFYSWDQPDTRWGLGLLWLSKVLYPGRSPGLEPEARRFYRLFYDLDDDSFNAVILPRMAGDWR
ncbi:MAG: ABC transporter substrate-binding protein [Spirochaetia bacterium]|nr:ABC transporter substrate-binding protein [Spirochaetia bacterium]